MIDDVLGKLEKVVLWRSRVEWTDCATRLETAAESSFDFEKIRLLNATRRLVEAAADYRQVYAEVTA